MLLGAFLILMLLGLPVALAMATSSLPYILVTGITPDLTLAQCMIAGVESLPLLAVPFFIFAGNLMNIAGATGRIYRFAVALVGWMRGGLGHVNIIGSVIFSGVSGTAIADAAGLGTIEITAMQERTTMAILPWLVPLFLALAAITYIPELTLFLPKYMGLVK